MMPATLSENASHPVLECRLCGDCAELLYPGVNDWADTGTFAPSSHEVGAHGDLYVCRRCGTVQTSELPSPELLESRYADTEDDQYLDEEAGRRCTARRLLDLLEKRVRTGRMLDIGCGHGLLMAEARDRGWDPIGLELSHSAAGHARSLGLEVLEQTIEEASLPADGFDAIVAVDLIEHLPEPRDFIRRCRELLAPGGALVIATPDPESPLARAFGRRWWGYIPAHLHLLPRRMLRELLQAEGLVLADDVPMVRDFSFDYWLAGLAGRGGALRWLEGALQRLRIPERPFGVALGDERVVLAIRAEPRNAERPLAARTEPDPNIQAVLPAYRAAATLPEVAAQLPGGSVNRALVVDDASPDETASVAHAQGFDVIVHPANRGYGANQKTCYVNALRDGADVVVMVHADNQYDPRLLPAMVQPIVEGYADVVIGSRLLNDQAIVGGMPRWKWVGNKFLTWAENVAFRRHYSEYHTGYRAFSAEFLRSVAFLRNSDAFVFDQEIFAQAVARGARVYEVAIPTRYFLEASSVSFKESVKYGLRTLVVLARFRAHEAGMSEWPLLHPPAFRLGPDGPSAPGAAGGAGTPPRP
jgi:SAM-dependent methyltransferase